MKAILHIGAPKTGSTSIEAFLLANEAALSERGAALPRSTGRASAVGLTLYAQSVWRRSGQRKANGLADRRGFLDHRARLSDALIAEAAGLRKTHDVMLFSTETLWALLRTKAEVARLGRLMREIADETRVIVYLRRQDRFALSLYATQARFGRVRPFQFPSLWQDRMYRYAERLAQWAAVFGPDALQVRPFEPGQLKDGDLLSDFAEQAGLGPIERFARPDPANPAPRSAVVEFMRRMNALIPRFDGAGINAARGPIGDLAELVDIASPKISAPAEAARRFLARFEKGNAAVARRYLGRDDGALFRDDRFEQDPGAGYLGELTADEAIAIAAQLWALRERISQS